MLHRAIQAARAGDLATLRALASSGHLSAVITDAQGAGPVHHAARCGRLECLKVLVSELGLAADSRALNRATPAHDAAATGHVQELQWLVDQGGCNTEVRLSAGSISAQAGRENPSLGAQVPRTGVTCPLFLVTSTDCVACL